MTATKTHLPPTRIADETWVIHDHEGDGEGPFVVPMNAMVIRGREPVVVDTGAPGNRDQLLADLFGIVEPQDVRWVFLSHDDVDHFGNLQAVLDACPQAKLVTTWYQMQRLSASGFAVPPTRMRWVDDGESFATADRAFIAARPPVYDSPTTRGLFDTRTGVYWAADCFAALVPQPAADIAEVAPDVWEPGFFQFHQALSPWIEMVDPAQYQLRVHRLQALGISTIATCHSPTITGANVARAFDLLRAVPSAPGHAPARPGRPG